MTKVKDLIEYLKTLPEDMIVCVIQEYSEQWNMNTQWSDLVLPDKHGYSPNITEFKTQVWLGER